MKVPVFIPELRIPMIGAPCLDPSRSIALGADISLSRDSGDTTALIEYLEWYSLIHES
jgi:hypothetical protein